VAPPALRIRPARPVEAELLFRLRTAVRENHQSRAELAALGITPESVAAMLRDGGRHAAWLAWLGPEAAGFAMADAAGATHFALFLRPGFEGRGIGGRLLGTAEGWLATRGCAAAWLLTGAGPGLRAPGFYRHLGWMEEGIAPDGSLRFRKALAGGAAAVVAGGAAGA
jgi:GNAT superfamily N-acetyltransferase